jgi:histidinol phosphatase-like PHP family hydrolase
MIDLHVHSVLSDGELIPSEIIRRVSELENRGVAITDHADFAVIPHIMSCLRRMQDLRDDYEIPVLLGVEITHVPPKLIGRAVELALAEGAELIVVHGETVVEPVAAGTNFAAVNEEVDILAHPGILDKSTAELAAENGIYVEITTRRGHSLTNGLVAKLSSTYGFRLVINTDAHSPGDFVTRRFAEKVLRGAGVEKVDDVLRNSEKLLDKKLKKI